MTPEISASSAAESQKAPATLMDRAGNWFSFNNRYLPPLLITCILLAGQLSFGFLESYWKTALAIAVAMAVEVTLSRIYAGRWPHLASAYISGISVGILVRSPAIWPFALCSAIAITSKYVLRVRGRHLWNPSNFGICVMLFLAYDTVASLSVQWGNTLWPMLIVWVLGSVIIYRLRRFHICVTYVISFLICSLIRSAVTGHPWLAEVAPITGPMYQLFVFFMITDPKTTVHSFKGQCVVAALVAVMEMILRLNQVVHAPYYALFIVGPAANLIELALTRRKLANTPTSSSTV
jgi:Na+-transporting NADH:ubiquinone oxidoreductase subunit NqrB